MEDDDPLLEEDFSPQDLASDVPPSDRKTAAPAPMTGSGVSSPFSSPVGVVAGYGLAVTRGDWGWMLRERNLTIDGLGHDRRGLSHAGLCVADGLGNCGKVERKSLKTRQIVARYFKGFRLSS